MELTMQKANIKFNNIDIGEAAMVEMTIEPDLRDIPAPSFSMEGEFNMSLANGAVRKLLGYGLVHDIKKPLDMSLLRAEYRDHQIKLDSPIQHYVIPGPLYKFYVPVTIKKVMQGPFDISRSYDFYVKVKAENASMAASLAMSIIKHRWATPKHLVNISINGTVQF